MLRRFLEQRLATLTVSKRADGKPVITGYASVFYNPSEPGTEFKMFDDLVERIMPGAFNRAVAEKHDARGLFNHDPSLVLGRVGNGTVRLSLDGRGLRYEIDPPDTTVGRDLVISIERGDVAGSSFAFVPKRVVWAEENGVDVRQILDLDLYDVSPVTYPAYEGASTGLRSTDAEAVKLEREAWRRTRNQESGTGSQDEVAVRLRMLELDEA